IAETCEGLAEMAEKTLAEGFLPLVLGGDHSIAIGTCSGVSDFFRKQSKKIGCLWLDAHGDMNTPESSPSGNVHGMPLASLIGYGAPELVELLGFKPKVEPRNVAIVGVRDLDAKERRLVKDSSVHAFTMRDIVGRGDGAFRVGEENSLGFTPGYRAVHGKGDGAEFMAENKRLRVGVIFGGRSGEHEVSLASAASVIRALDPEKYEAVPIGVAKDGRWFIGTPVHKMLPDVLRQGQRVMLSADPNVAALMPLE